MHHIHVFHSALRFITGDAYDTHHCVLYGKAGWSSLKERREAHWQIFIYKALSGRFPHYLTVMLQISDGLFQTRSAACSSFMVLKSGVSLE